MPDPIETPPIEFKTSGIDSANATYVASYGQAIGDSDTNGGIAKYDKPEGDVHETNNQFLALDDYAVMSDGGSWVVQKELNLTARAVAASELAKAMGLNCLAEEAYGMDGNGRPVGVSAFVNGSPLTMDKDGSVTTFAHDLTNPEVQRGLYDLEAFDYLVGQVDRHEGNIFIEAGTGKVKGIDNDLCFGEKRLEDAVTGEIQQKAVGRPPDRFHPDTAAKIEALTPDRLRQILYNSADPNSGKGLNETEVENAVERLAELKVAVQKARVLGRVSAGQFEDPSLAQEELAKQLEGEVNKAGRPDTTVSYLGRALEKQRHVQQVISNAIQNDRNPDELPVKFVEPKPRQEANPAQQQLIDAKAMLEHARREALQGSKAKQQQKHVTACKGVVEKYQGKITTALGKMPASSLDNSLEKRRQLCNIAAPAMQFGQNDTMRPTEQAAIAKLVPGWQYNQETKLLCDADGRPLTPAIILQRGLELKKEGQALRTQIEQNKLDVLERVGYLNEKLGKAAAKLERSQERLDEMVSKNPAVQQAMQAVEQARKSPAWAAEVHQRLAPPPLVHAFVNMDSLDRERKPRMVMGRSNYQPPLTSNMGSSSSSSNDRGADDDLPQFDLDDDQLDFEVDHQSVPQSIDPSLGDEFGVKLSDLEDMSADELRGEIERLNTEHHDSPNTPVVVAAMTQALDAKLNAEEQLEVSPRGPMAHESSSSSSNNVESTWRNKSVSPSTRVRAQNPVSNFFSNRGGAQMGGPALSSSVPAVTTTTTTPSPLAARPVPPPPPRPDRPLGTPQAADVTNVIPRNNTKTLKDVIGHQLESLKPPAQNDKKKVPTKRLGGGDG